MENALIDWHKEVFDVFRFMSNQRIVASYIGPFDKHILVSLGVNFKNNLWDDATQAKKFFKIFIELAHNISLYSTEKESGTGAGTIIINDHKDYFVLNAGNLVTDEAKNKLSSHIMKINSLDRNGLRILKRKLLSMPSQNQDSGNIGLIQTALISRYPLRWKFFPVTKDNRILYFYLISVRIDKKYGLTNA